MKKMKKALAVILAAAMACSMSLAAFAEPDETPAAEAAATITRSITIDGLEDATQTQPADKVNFYKVLSWDGDSESGKAKGAVNGWYWEEPFATAFATGGDHGEAKLRAAINDKNQLYLTDTLAGEIARVLNGRTVTPVNSSPISSADGEAVYTFTPDQPAEYTGYDGLYMAIITPGKQDTTYNPVFVHLDSKTTNDSYAPTSSADYMNKGVAKKSEVELEKEAHNKADYNNDDGDTTKPGDILDFHVKTTIPGYGDMFIEPAYKLTDTMNGLKLLHGEKGDIIIKVGGAQIAATNYKLDDQDGYYTIEFEPEYLKTLKVAVELTVDYQAEVLEGANTNVIKEKNTVKIEYSHDPTTESEQKPGGDKQYKKDITNHYTFSIDANNLVGPGEGRIGESGSEIIKVGVDANGKPITSEKVWSNVTTVNYQEGPLDGAEFELLDKDKKSFDPKKTAVSDASGRLNFSGLDAGEYWLQETKAPAGYVKQTNPVKITITATMKERSITEYYDQDGNWYEVGGEGRTAFTYTTEELDTYTVTYGDDKASEYTFDHAFENDDEIKWSIAESEEIPQSWENPKGVELPSTGGMGTTIFYIIGSILVIGAGVILVSRRRMSAR